LDFLLAANMSYGLNTTKENLLNSYNSNTQPATSMKESFVTNIQVGSISLRNSSYERFLNECKEENDKVQREMEESTADSIIKLEVPYYKDSQIIKDEHLDPLQRKDSGIRLEALDKSNLELKSLLKETCQMAAEIQKQKTQILASLNVVTTENEILKRARNIQQAELDNMKNGQLDGKNGLTAPDYELLSATMKENESLQSKLDNLFTSYENNLSLAKAQKEIAILKSQLMVKNTGEDFKSAKVIGEWQHRAETAERDLKTMIQNQLTITNDTATLGSNDESNSILKMLLELKNSGNGVEELHAEICLARTNLSHKDKVIAGLNETITKLYSEKLKGRLPDTTVTASSSKSHGELGIKNSDHNRHNINNDEMTKLLSHIELQNNIISNLELEKQRFGMVLAKSDKAVERTKAVSDFLAAKLKAQKEGALKSNKKWKVW
jgi:hypothetical protein